MKNYIFFLLLSISLSSCRSFSYLPKYNKITSSPYGSRMAIKKKNGSNFTGELIMVKDTVELVLFIPKEKSCVTIKKDEIKRFTLYYAKPPKYVYNFYSVPLSPIIHGFASIITLPANVAITSALMFLSYMDYSYSHEEIPFNKLYFFARFPQGIPDHIQLKQIGQPNK
ncbi:MAG TPA: hypothetical protein PK006_03960 [Saprospiraceae bacterium]|nr:hypothetical protein [Saprospiraceae bacterium]